MDEIGNDGFEIPPVEIPADHDLEIEIERLASKTEGVSISLKYYQEKVECFSDWQSKELKKLSGLVAKVRNMPVNQLIGSGALCVSHKGKPKANKYSWPDRISEEIQRYELKVDPANKARIHGALIGSTFYLVWLDRNHLVFPK